MRTRLLSLGSGNLFWGSPKRGGTLMRHNLLPAAIPGLAAGMIHPATEGPLVAPPGLSLGDPAGGPPAPGPAVDLAPVTTPANEDPLPAPGAVEKPQGLVQPDLQRLEVDERALSWELPYAYFVVAHEVTGSPGGPTRPGFFFQAEPPSTSRLHLGKTGTRSKPDPLGTGKPTWGSTGTEAAPHPSIWEGTTAPGVGPRRH